MFFPSFFSMKKLCSKCGETKDVEQFSRDRSRPDGRQYICKTCRQQWWRDNPGYRYGLSREDYDALLVHQKSRCAICGNGFKENEPFVDHNHVTGKVRGLICYHCNLLLGHAHDNPGILRAAADYLEEV